MVNILASYHGFIECSLFYGAFLRWSSRDDAWICCGVLKFFSLLCIVAGVRMGKTLRQAMEDIALVQACKLSFESVVVVDVLLGFCSFWVRVCCLHYHWMGNWRLHVRLEWWSYQVSLVQVASSSLTVYRFVALLVLYASTATRNKMMRDVFWWFNGAFLGSIPIPADNLFQRWSWSDVLQYAVDCERALLLGWITRHRISARRRCWHIGGKVCLYGCLRAWRWCNKVVDVDITGAWYTRLMETVVGIPLSTVAVYDWTMITRKRLSLRSNSFLYVGVVKDNASLFLVATSGVWRRVQSHTAWITVFQVCKDRTRVCIVDVIS